MGQVHRFLGLTVGRVSPEIADFEDKRDAYAGDVTYGTNTEFGFDYLRDNMARSRGRHGAARPRLRHRRRGRLDPHRRGPHAAHHLGPGGRVGQALLPVRRPGPDADAPRRTTRSTRRSASSSRPRRASPRSSGQLGVDNMYDAGVGQLRPPPDPGAAGQGALPPGQGLPRRRRRGEDRRRVHRPHPRGPALVRRPAPGGRGQGAGAGSRRRTTPGPRSPSRTTSGSTRSWPA